MSKEEMLKFVQGDRPEQIIDEVLEFKSSKTQDIYAVLVKMKSMIGKVVIRDMTQVIPYPLSEFEKLNIGSQYNWRCDNKIKV